MTRRDDLELSHGAIAKDRENAVKQDRVRVTNAIGHHPERSGFLRRTEFIGGTASGWLHVGATQGRGRYDRDKLYDKPRKDIWLRPLRKDWKYTLNRQNLRDRTNPSRPVGTFTHDAGVQPFPDQADDPPVADAVLKERDQPIPRDRVKIRPEVCIDYPADLAPLYPEGQGVERIVRPPAPVGTRN